MEKFLATCAALLSAGACWAAAPRTFFTDLTSGPKSGGQNNAGAFVTIYGRNFGVARGNSSVTVGGAPAGAYPMWSDTKIAIQLGAAAVTGKIVVTTPAGASNGVQFTVRSGHIYFVSANGNDKNSGRYSSPWQTLMKARDAMQPGDTTYAMNGVAQTGDDGSGWQASLLLRGGGTAVAPMAFVVYPQAIATIGSVTGPPSGIRTARHKLSELLGVRGLHFARTSVCHGAMGQHGLADHRERSFVSHRRRLRSLHRHCRILFAGILRKQRTRYWQRYRVGALSRRLLRHR